jgi:hypothetical protein
VKALFGTFCTNNDTTGAVSLVLEVLLRHYCSSLETLQDLTPPIYPIVTTRPGKYRTIA